MAQRWLVPKRNGAQRSLYGTVQWLGALDIYAMGKSSCANPPTPGLASMSKVHTKHFVKQYPYYPRVFATDSMEIRDMNISLSRNGQIIKTWKFSATAARRLSTSGRKLLKGGSSSGGSSPSRHSNRGSSSRSYRTAAGVTAYSTTRYGGRRRRAIEATSEGIVQAIYSPVPIVGERLVASTTTRQAQVRTPIEQLPFYWKTLQNKPFLQKLRHWCDVEIYNCLAACMNWNGNGIFFDPNNDFSEGSQDFYEVHTSVHARYDELKAATSAGLGTQPNSQNFCDLRHGSRRPRRGIVCHAVHNIVRSVVLHPACEGIPFGINFVIAIRMVGRVPRLSHIAHSAMSFNSSQTYDVPSRYTENVDPTCIGATFARRLLYQ